MKPYLSEGTKRMKKMTEYIGIDLNVEDDNLILVELATAYAIVKMMMPVRIAMSIYLAPGMARLDTTYITIQ